MSTVTARLSDGGKGSDLLLTFVSFPDDLFASFLNLSLFVSYAFAEAFLPTDIKISCQMRLTMLRSGNIVLLLVCVQCVQVTKEGNHEHGHCSLVR